MTKYQSGGRTFGSAIWAESMREAKGLMERRGIGEQFFPNETVTARYVRRSYKRASTVVRSWKTGDMAKLHAVTWLCNLALASGVADRERTVGDCGVLHELVHSLGGIEGGAPIKKIVGMIVELENEVPGYLAPDERL